METCDYAIESGIIALMPEGSLTTHSYPDLENIVMNNIVYGVTTVVMNMDRVDFIDMSGAVFLLRLASLVEIKGCRFELFNPSDNVIRLLESIQQQEKCLRDKERSSRFVRIRSINNTASKVSVLMD